MNIIKKITVVCIVLLNTGTVWAQSDIEIKELNNEGKRLYEMAHFAEADSVLRKAIAIQERDTTRMLGNDYLDSLSGLAAVTMTQGKYTQSNDIYTKMMSFAKRTYGDSSIEYAKTLSAVGRLRVALQQFSSVEDMLKTALDIFTLKTGESNDDYADALIHLGMYYISLGKYKEAESQYLKAAQIRRDLGGENSIKYANALIELGTLKFMTQDFQASEDYYKKSLAIIYNHKDDQFSIQSLAVLYLLSNLYSNTGRYQDAKTNLQECFSIITRYGSRNHPYYIPVLSNLGTVFMILGEYNEAEPVLLETLGITKATLGEKHSYYFNALNSLSLLYWKKGEYEKAELLILESLTLRKELYGTTHTSVSTALLNISTFYTETGNYLQAEKAILEANEITISTIGENSTNYTQGLNTLANLYIELKEYDKAYPLLLKAEDIQKTIVGTENLTYLAILGNLFSTAMYGNYLDNATLENIAKKIVQGQKEFLGENHFYYFTALSNLAEFYNRADSLYKAREIYDSLLVSTKQVLGEENPLYSKIVYKSALNHELTGNIEQAKHSFISYLDLSKIHVIRNFAFMPENERELYWKTLNNSIKRCQSFADRYKSNDPTLAHLAYDCELFSKNLLLSSSKAIRQSIFGSNDEQLIADWNSLMTLKNNSQNNADTIRFLEKRLMVNSKEYQRQKESFSTTWKDIASSLADDEAAIEFITYEAPDSTGVTERIYTALILRRNGPQAELAMLTQCEESSLKQAIGSSGYDFEKLYPLVWNSMDNILNGVKKVYVSPIGLLNSVPFAAIKNKGEYISDKYTIHTVLSSKDIISLKNDSTQPSNKNAILFGGADFGLSTSELGKPGNISEDKALKSLLSEFRGERGQGFDYLPGSKQEVEKISIILSKQNWKVSTFADKNATETHLKFSLSQDSPSLLHISTHGYYFPLVKESVFNNTISETNKFYKQSDNPLIRCGLLFSGANSTWNGQEQPENPDDGILTAYEISNLNLSNTDLVVLSACETGLGDMDYSEGIYGLQRAFRLAGAKSMIVSLWKVLDKDALEFMVEFYQQWALVKDKKEAFDKAQGKMRKKYDEVKKWAGFILVE